MHRDLFLPIVKCPRNVHLPAPVFPSEHRWNKLPSLDTQAMCPHRCRDVIIPHIIEVYREKRRGGGGEGGRG